MSTGRDITDTLDAGLRAPACSFPLRCVSNTTCPDMTYSGFRITGVKVQNEENRTAALEIKTLQTYDVFSNIKHEV